MKIRTSFVANSSSSSYIFIGTWLDIKDVKKYTSKDLEDVYLFGDQINEGRDIFLVNENLFNIMKETNFFDKMDENGFNFVRVCYMAETYEESLIDFREMPKIEANFFQDTIDYNVTEDVDTFIERYEKFIDMDKLNINNLLKE